jgi:tetratricopeptide (TPR) repeat protein
MARIAGVCVLITIILYTGGCNTTHNDSLMLPPRTSNTPIIGGTDFPVDLTDMSEVDIVEQVALSRQEYRQGLRWLSDHYSKAGDNRKEAWARRELSSLNRIPQYNYVGDVIPSADLRAKLSIPVADALYLDAQDLQREAGLLNPRFVGIPLPYVRNSNTLRMALNKYSLLIKRYSESDKIDDAAFQAGYIHEHFKEYGIALTYYQRAFQWDSRTPHPARFRAANILDKRLHRKAEAVEMYQQALSAEGTQWLKWKEFAAERVRVLTNSGSNVN